MVTYLTITHWHWWGLAGLLIIGELLAPCYYFMAVGTAAGLTGLVVRHLPGMPGLWQIGLFVLLSIITLLTAHRLKRRKQSARMPDNHMPDP